MPPLAHPFNPPTQKEIAVLAALIWETEGRPAGRDVEIWLQAEAHLRAARLHDAAMAAPAQTPAGAEKPAPADGVAVNSPKATAARPKGARRKTGEPS